MDTISFILAGLVVILVGVAIYLWKKAPRVVEVEVASKIIEMSEEEAISKASDKANGVLEDSKNEAVKIKAKAEQSASDLRNELESQRKRLDEREHGLIDRGAKLDQRFDNLDVKEEELEVEREIIKKRRDELEHKLEEVAGYTREEAKVKLMDEVEKDLKNDIAKKIRQAEEQIKAKSDDIAKEILVDAMQKSATDYVAETTVTTLEIPNDDMKGRIIGKEGRNIKTFKKLTRI